ncbi:hypothetical protein ONZ45_g4403 [Pleurotus djamor]|nr:hypothetical protein ONZ45_g4403 [Pleurotus djamor]
MPRTYSEWQQLKKSRRKKSGQTSPPVTTNLSPVESSLALFTEGEIAGFIRRRIEHGLAIPETWRHINLHALADIIGAAYRNQVRISVTSAQMCNPTLRTKKLEGTSLGLIKEPTVIVTEDDVPILVYLPKVISSNVQAETMASVTTIGPILEHATKGKKGEKSWRTNPSNCKTARQDTHLIGAQNFSYGWRMSGFENTDSIPETSASLYKPMNKPANSTRTETWLAQSAHLFTLVNVILGVVHPKSYQAGIRAKECAEREGSGLVKHWAQIWKSAFSALTVIANRSCDSHLDIHSPLKQYDMLTNFGCNDVQLNLESLGATLTYSSGTLVAFSGRMLSHGVDWKIGDRLGYAFYMREEMQAHFGGSEDIRLPAKGEVRLAEYGWKGQKNGKRRRTTTYEVIKVGPSPSPSPRKANNVTKATDPQFYGNPTEIFPYEDGPLGDDLVEAFHLSGKVSHHIFGRRHNNIFRTGQQTEEHRTSKHSWIWMLPCCRGFAVNALPTTDRFINAEDALACHFIVVIVVMLSTSVFPFITSLSGPNEDSYPALYKKPGSYCTWDMRESLVRLSMRDLMGLGLVSVSPISNIDHYTQLFSARLFPATQDHANSKGNMAVTCCACARPGVNVTERTWSTSDAGSTWMLNPMLVIDGNFKFDMLKMRHPETDVQLRDGRAYMVSRSTYAKHLASTPSHQEQSTCVNHKAVNKVGRIRGHLAISGIGAVACARHGYVVPHSVVDFEKGERQVYIDYAVSEAMKFYTSHDTSSVQYESMTLIYDVMCQYGVHLLSRLKAGEYLDVPPVRIRQAVGKFHLGAHVDGCYVKFSLGLLKGAAHTDGEVLETIWSTLNRVSGCTRSMTQGHRQEVLDDSIAESNRKKALGMGSAMLSKWRRACSEFEDTNKAYDELRQRIEAENLTLWDGMARKADEEGGDAMKVYEVDEPKRETLGEVRLRLSQKELSSNEEVLGAAAFISSAFDVEWAQLSLKRQIKSDSGIRQIKNLYKQLGEINVGEPDGADADDDDDEANTSPNKGPIAEDMVLPLPSSLVYSSSSSRGLSQLAQKELEMREAQIEDALFDLRVVLAEKSLRFRKELRRDKSQKKSTRAWSGIRSLDEKANLCVDVFDHAVLAIARLDIDRSKRWKPINHSTDFFVKGDAEHPNRVGQSSFVLPWFWRQGDGNQVSKDTNESPYLKEYYRVAYLNAKARRTRWEEEKALLQKEMTWVLEWHRTESLRWESISKRSEEFSEGAASYALRRADLLVDAAGKLAKRWSAAGIPAVVEYLHLPK